MNIYPALEEDLAEAINEDFYDSYKTWTLDNPNAKTSQKVCFKYRTKFKPYFQSRQWVRSWRSHLGKRATPEAIVDVINKKKLTQATLLGDKVREEFNLESREACMSYEPKCKSKRTHASELGQTVLVLGIGMGVLLASLLFRYMGKK